jgi:hypothetical protein
LSKITEQILHIPGIFFIKGGQGPSFLLLSKGFNGGLGYLLKRTEISRTPGKGVLKRKIRISFH